MNVESLKSELQQVLDNDVVLRKEFNELKRSLSDYRNQLIMRDEDCKRLQVTIDVLNTKLVVMERDNTTYKAELTSFKELRSTIKDQLQTKQDEIEGRLLEIQSLRNELSVISAGYEQKLAETRQAADNELQRLSGEFTGQIEELKNSGLTSETLLRSHYETKISDLNNEWQQRENTLTGGFEVERNNVKLTYEQELRAVKESYESKIAGLSLGSQTEIDRLIATNQETISRMESDYSEKLELLEGTYKNEIIGLRNSLEEQRSTLTFNFNNQIESLRNEYEGSETRLREGYEQRIAELQAIVSASREEISAGFQNEINLLKTSHQTLLGETVAAHEARVNTLINEYEEKLSVTLIHSNSQNSKLTEELATAHLNNESLTGQVQSLGLNLQVKTTEAEGLAAQISNLEALLNSEIEKYTALTNEFENYKYNASLSVNEQVNELNNQIAGLNLSHSDYVNELNGRIESLSTELNNLGLLFESNTNTLSETESRLEMRVSELEASRQEIVQLQASIALGEQNLEQFKLDLQNATEQQVKVKETEFQKLLAENTILISEIDEAQGKVEALEAEVNLLKSELEDLRIHSAAKVNDFKETLSAKNFEITNLEATNAALQQELVLVKQELANALNQIQEFSMAGDQVAQLQQTIEQLTAERTALENEIRNLQTSIQSLNTNVATLNGNIVELNAKINAYESEIGELKNNSASAQQDAFIDKLFKQIDGLNDERLALLNEKEQMANQLLKMNDVVGALSQQVDSERIDVTDLNNHRKNVILASNSDEVTEKSQMKEQINDLVREIDKCIALLSA